MKTTFFKRELWPVILSLLLCQTGLAAVNFTVTPPAISNTYSGTIVMQVTGLTNTETVVVQKYLDANANGVVDAPDFLVQQFDLTDGSAGMVIGGVTNINVPGDTDDSVNGQITAQLHPSFNFVQVFVGKYLFVLSSPVGHFSPQTKSFSVTNFPYAQTISGHVVNSGTNVPNAVIILFPPPRGGDHGPGEPVGGTVANNSGAYSIQVPPGSYVPLAFKSNYVANFGTSPVLTLSGSQTITTNLTLTNATSIISGRVVDADNNALGLPGLTVPISSDSGLIAVGFTDTNGYFNVPVTSGSWSIDGSAAGSFSVLGYVGYNDSYDVSAGQSGIILPVHKATALFYGSVKDSSGNPLAGIPIEARDQPNNDNDGTYDNDGYSDTNGNYVTGAVGGLGSDDTWQLDVDNESSVPNYLFSQPAINQNGGTNLAVGIAVHQNFTGILATNHITGNVQFNGSPVMGVQVDAYATIGGVSYNANSVDTDSNGNYSLNVANGTGGTTWNVNIYDCNCSDSDSLSTVLNGQSYQDPPSQNVTINNNNGTANFTVPTCNGVQITTINLPDGTNGVYYYQRLSASSCSGNITWSISSGSLPSNFTLDQVGELFGTPNSSGTFNFIVHADDGNGHTANQSLSLYIAPAAPGFQITMTSLPNGTNGVFYSQQFQASGGATPYTWSLNGNMPFSLTLSTNGILSGTPNYSGTNTFTVFVTDSNGVSIFTNLTLVVNSSPGPLQINTFYLPNGTNDAFYNFTFQASGGTPPYSWSIPNYSGPLPANLTLSTEGVLSGTISAQAQIYTFYVDATDSASGFQEGTFNLNVVNPPPPPLIITNVSLPNGSVGVAYSAQLGATGGQPPYYWQIAAGSANPPPGLTLNSSGLISGTPTTNKVSTFKVQVTDSSVSDSPTNKVFSITINSQPVISSPAKTSAQFEFLLSGAANQNYTLQYSSNLLGWTPLFVTNNPATNSFLVIVPNATNAKGFYRLLIGP